MFALLRVALRSFTIGVAVGMLFAPRPGPETRRMLGERFTSAIDSILELAAMPPLRPEHVRTNGHTERPARRGRSTPATRDPNARSS